MRPTSPHSILPIVFLALLIIAPARTAAQTPTTAWSLEANQYKINRLAPGVLTDQSVFHVDQSNNVTVEIIASSGGINTSIVLPTGQVIDPGNVSGLGGSFQLIDATSPQSGPFILPTVIKGFHYLYTFPNQGSGDYTVRFQAASNPSDEIAIFTQVTTDSKIGVAFFATEPIIILGSPVVLSAALLSEQTAVAGADISVLIKLESGSQFNLTLRDDGGAADGAAGDGLYSGEFTPTTAGKYTALARIKGTEPGSGSPFTREAITSFSVVQPTSQLTGNVSDQGVDDNNNNLFDRVTVTAGVNAQQSGKHRLFVHLKTASGASILRSAEQDLQTGVQNIQVNFEASAFTSVGENGPYIIETLELDFLGANGATPADRLFAQGLTQPYQLSKFEQASLAFIGITSVEGQDTNNNNLFDRLVVLAQVKVQTAGSYSWVLKLTDQSRKEIDFTSASGTLAAGLNTIRFEFKGSAIGASGINGPYLLRDLLLHNQSSSLVQTDAGQTSALKAEQFEGFNGNISNLGLTVSASSATVAPGGTLTYTINVTNGGPRSAPSVIVTDNLPPSLTFSSCSATGGGICSGTGNNRTVTIASLDAQATVTITLIATVNSGLADGSIINTASVSSLASDPNTSNNTASVTTALQTPKLQFSASSYSVNEAAGAALINVTRTGDLSATATIDFATSDPSGLVPCQLNGNGIASERCDYATAVGTLRFAAGEQSKTIQIPIINDAYVEPAETFTITLRNAQGANLGATSTTTVTITSDDTQTATANPIDSQDFFIKQQYVDFLGRIAEPTGFQFWMNRMNNCPTGQTCDRVDTSMRFFQSDEFQERGFYVYRLYDAVLGRLPRYSEFQPEVAILNGPQTVQEQRLGKDAYLLAFMNKADFKNLYGQYLNTSHTAATDAAMFVNALCARAGITPASKQTLINNLQSGARDPAHTLEDFILTPEMSNVGTLYYDRGFITMQYFGYLRRDPEQAGFDFWRGQLIGANAPHRQDYRFMVGGFLQSDEFRFRFALLSVP